MSELKFEYSDGYRLKCFCGWEYNVINDDPEHSAQSHLSTSGTYNHIVTITKARFVSGKPIPD